MANLWNHSDFFHAVSGIVIILNFNILRFNWYSEQRWRLELEDVHNGVHAQKY